MTLPDLQHPETIDTPMVSVNRRPRPTLPVLQVAGRQDLRIQIRLKGILIDGEARDR